MENTMQRLIHDVEEARGSRVIVYATLDRISQSPPAAQVVHGMMSEDAIPILHKHVLSIPEDERRKIDLVLYSRGGSSDVPWLLVSMFREYSDRFSVLIPYRAHSAATVVALGADEIVMTRKAELGPIDATIPAGPYNPRAESGMPKPVAVEDVKAFFRFVDSTLGCDGSAKNQAGSQAVGSALEHLLHDVHPLAVGSVHRVLLQTERIARNLLKTRRGDKPVPDVEAVVRTLTSEYGSHAHSISRTEARDIGLLHVKDADDYGLEETLWELYAEIARVFDLESPFFPEGYLEQQRLAEATWTGVPSVLVESANRRDVYTKSVRVRRLRQIPPNVTVNLNNVGLPPISIPPGVTDPDKLMEAVTNILRSSIPSLLQQAAEAAARELLQSLPQAGFEFTILDTRWEVQNHDRRAASVPA